MTTATHIGEKRLIGGSLQFQRFSPLSSWWEAWWHAGRCDSGEVARVLHPDQLAAGRETETETGPGLSIWDLKAPPPPHSDTLPPARPHLLTVPLPLSLRRPFSFKPQHCFFSHKLLSHTKTVSSCSTDAVPQTVKSLPPREAATVAQTHGPCQEKDRTSVMPMPKLEHSCEPPDSSSPDNRSVESSDTRT
jgi:hypothetical protein